MIVEQALEHARRALAGGDEAYLESQLLLMQALGIDRVQLYTSLEYELTRGEEAALRGLLERRLGGEPMAYIRGRREFCGRDFRVCPGVLIPRPESELLVEQAIEIARSRPVTAIADIGTGAGCVAISLALALPEVIIYASDISPDALAVAESNCRRHGVIDRVRLLEGDLLSPLPGAVDIIAANLPYVRGAELPGVNTAGFEPTLALDGGSDGLDKIRRLCQQAGDKLRPGGSIMLEIGQGQAEETVALLKRRLPSVDIEIIPDLAGIERMVRVTLSPITEPSPTY